MGLNIDMRPVLGYFFTDDQMAGDHRAPPGGAAPAIGTFVAGCRRERASLASWTSGTARRSARAQLGEGAIVVGGGGRRGREHGVDPPSGAGRAGVQKTSPPSCGAREHAPTLAAFARLCMSTAEKKALYACVVRRRNAFLMLPSGRAVLDLSLCVCYDHF